MSSDPWKKYVKARKEALRVYHEAIRETRDAFLEVDNVAYPVYLKVLEEARLEYKEASL